MTDKLRPWQAVLLGGLTVGTFDFIFAVVLFHASAQGVARSIASGWLGREAAFAGGTGVVVLGVLSHYFIATSMAAFYIALSRKLGFMVRYAVVSGMAYGVGCYWFMQLVVLPLSRVTRRPQPMFIVITSIIGHALLIGLPIALYARKAAPRST
jgi:hypothetical protein